MGAKKAEPELGSFDCVYSESGATPKVGKLHVFKTSLVFKAEMFGMDKTSVSIKRKDLDALDATSGADAEDPVQEDQNVGSAVHEEQKAVRVNSRQVQVEFDGTRGVQRERPG
jgi:hypothetical protein